MEVNFLGTFAVTQAFAPVLAKNGGGAIVNLNSVASFVSFPILAAYSASKAATHSLTQVTRAMLRGQNTQVFGVYPGPVDTRMGEALTAEKASPADAARAIVAGIIAGDDIHKTYEELRAKGVEFTEEPTERFYGTDCGLRDPFGNSLRIGQLKEGPIEIPDPAEFAAEDT